MEDLTAEQYEDQDVAALKCAAYTGIFD